MRLLHRLAIVVALGIATAPYTGATTVAPLTVEQKVDASDLVIRGTVESVWTDADEHGHIWTRALVRVDVPLKGDVDAGDYVTVEAAGGTFGEDRMVVPLSARYAVGEQTLLFLTDKPSRGLYGTVGMGMGKYTVRPDPRDGSPIIVQFIVSQEKPYDARFLPAPPVNERVALGDMEARIRARADLGWDGKPIPGLSAERLRSINKLQPGVR